MNNKLKSILISACALSATLSINAHSNSVFIDDITIFDSTGAAPFISDVLIENGRFVAIEPQLKAPDNAVMINGNGLSLVAGLTDVHTHWTSSRAEVATAMLTHGVTTVTDFHSSPDSYAPKREWHTKLISPHVIYAARIAPPGGHGADWADERMTRLVASTEEAKSVVAYLDDFKPDMIKVFADGWRYGRSKEDTNISPDALAEIVTQSALRGLPVVTHTVTVDGGMLAAKAGVSAIVHAIQDEPTHAVLPKLMADNNVYYAPTLAVYEIRPDRVARYSDKQIKAAQLRQTYSQQNFRSFLNAGVHLALGTDSGIGNTPFGESSVHEMELMVDFGATAKQALIAGTRGGAEALGLADDRGTIATGKRADFVIVDGKPWENISDYRKLKSVFIDGKQVVADNKLTSEQGAEIPPAIIATENIDDFEAMEGKTQYGTLRKTNIDYGFPRSQILTLVKPATSSSNKVLSVSIALENKKNPKAGVLFPLSQGSFYPVDASNFKGVSFAINAKPSTYTVTLDSYAGKSSVDVNISASGWQTITIPFNHFVKQGKLDIGLLKSISIDVTGKPEETFWIELDDVKFTP
ncbi:amidohydrolase family protein [Paraglaciecola sp. 2405UD69-4]|uniref:amidohydrolase family protein n=1 Tax=Paraglaciecola sp. 2405UD69-4 TaxID=3391836 RepID=UPI0039C94C8B